MSYFWVGLLFLLVLMVVLSYLQRKYLSAKTKNDELLPRVKEMLPSKPTGQQIMDVRNKLMAEGIDNRRALRLISVLITPKLSKRFWVAAVAGIVVIVIIIFRYNSSSTTNVGPMVYTNSSEGYQIDVPINWVEGKKPNSVALAENGANISSTTIILVDIQSKQITSKNVNDPGVQQQEIQSVYQALSSNVSGTLSENLSALPPYIDTTQQIDQNQVHIRYYYFFGNNRIYVVAVNVSENLWVSILPQIEQLVLSFKVI